MNNIKRYEWKPKEDITSYELAQCVSIIILTATDMRAAYDYEEAIESLPENTRRHFEEIKP